MTISDKQALDDHKEIPWCTDARIAEKQIDIIKRAWRRANESEIRDLKAQACMVRGEDRSFGSTASEKVKHGALRHLRRMTCDGKPSANARPTSTHSAIRIIGEAGAGSRQA
jgi:hypothetical protein